MIKPENSEKLIKKGTKKLFSLTKTKIRLAEEAKTKETKPKPLPLVKFFSGKNIGTVKEAKKYLNELSKEKLDFRDKRKIAELVFKLLDIIEGVKYKFEPEDCCFLLTEKELKEIENKKQEVKILIMTKKSHLSDKKREVALFIGDNTPKDTILISKVPSSIAIFLNFAFHSKYFHKNRQLEHITSILGNKTLLTNLIHFSLGEFGVILKEE